MPPDARTTKGLQRDVVAASQRYLRLRLQQSSRLAAGEKISVEQQEELLRAKMDLDSHDRILEARLMLQDEQLVALHAIAQQLRVLTARLDQLVDLVSVMRCNAPPPSSAASHPTSDSANA